VIVDATFHRRSERAAFQDGLADPGAPLLVVECRASTEVLMARARERELDRERTSDASAAIVQRQLAEAEPLDEVPDEARMTLITEAPPEALAAAVEGFVDDRLAAG
jgi:predicted kinase